jgi:hypothetical protein
MASSSEVQNGDIDPDPSRAYPPPATICPCSGEVRGNFIVQDCSSIGHFLDPDLKSNTRICTLQENAFLLFFTSGLTLSREGAPFCDTCHRQLPSITSAKWWTCIGHCGNDKNSGAEQTMFRPTSLFCEQCFFCSMTCANKTCGKLGRIPSSPRTAAKRMTASRPFSAS